MAYTNDGKFKVPDGLPVDNCIFTITSKLEETARKKYPERKLEVLLIQRSDDARVHPNQWAFPGGFTEEFETLEQSAYRELEEETGIGRDVHMEQLGAYYKPGRDPGGWIPTIVYVALVNEERLNNIVAGSDAKNARLFPVEEALKMNLAFDHNEILQDALVRIQRKMMTTTIAQEFLPEEFTIKELYRVIKAVVPDFLVTDENKGDEEKIIPNFLRNMTSAKTRKGIIEGVYGASGKPKKTSRHSNTAAKLYRYTGHSPKISIYNSNTF